MPVSDRGRMDTSPHPFDENGKPLLPTDDNQGCSGVDNTVKCFMAGTHGPNVCAAEVQMTNLDYLYKCMLELNLLAFLSIYV